MVFPSWFNGLLVKSYSLHCFSGINMFFSIFYHSKENFLRNDICTSCCWNCPLSHPFFSLVVQTGQVRKGSNLGHVRSAKEHLCVANHFLGKIDLFDSSIPLTYPIPHLPPPPPTFFCVCVIVLCKHAYLVSQTHLTLDLFDNFSIDNFFLIGWCR